jgi:hypothetical protein
VFVSRQGERKNNIVGVFCDMGIALSNSDIQRAYKLHYA